MHFHLVLLSLMQKIIVEELKRKWISCLRTLLLFRVSCCDSLRFVDKWQFVLLFYCKTDACNANMIFVIYLLASIKWMNLHTDVIYRLIFHNIKADSRFERITSLDFVLQPSSWSRINRKYSSIIEKMRSLTIALILAVAFFGCSSAAPKESIPGSKNFSLQSAVWKEK